MLRMCPFSVIIIINNQLKIFHSNEEYFGIWSATRMVDDARCSIFPFQNNCNFCFVFVCLPLSAISKSFQAAELIPPLAVIYLYTVYTEKKTIKRILIHNIIIIVAALLSPCFPSPPPLPLLSRRPSLSALFCCFVFHSIATSFSISSQKPIQTHCRSKQIPLGGVSTMINYIGANVIVIEQPEVYINCVHIYYYIILCISIDPSTMTEWTIYHYYYSI